MEPKTGTLPPFWWVRKKKCNGKKAVGIGEARTFGLGVKETGRQ